VGCSSSNKDIEINPSIRYKGNAIFIKNNDLFDYQEVKITLNGTYKFILDDSILTGSEIELNLLRFLKSDGERFDIFKYSIKDISISCKAIKRVDKFDMDYLGTAFYHGKFNQ
jgi:hypothetical protein